MTMTGQDDAGRGGNRKVILLVAVLAALGVSVGYQVWSGRKENVRPVTRRTFDFLVTWRCLECGHTTTDNADVGPKICPECNKEALYASLKWACPKHGVFDVAFQYDENGKPARIKFSGKEWMSAWNEYGGWNMSCPKCGGGMNPAEAPRTRP